MLLVYRSEIPFVSSMIFILYKIRLPYRFTIGTRGIQNKGPVFCRLTIFVSVSTHGIGRYSISSPVVTHNSHAIQGINSQIFQLCLRVFFARYYTIPRLASVICVNQTVPKDVPTSYPVRSDFLPRDVEAS